MLWPTGTARLVGLDRRLAPERQGLPAQRLLLRLDPTEGAKVTDVALRHGFPHTGRFAAAYRTRFGESPSTTLRR